MKKIYLFLAAMLLSTAVWAEKIDLSITATDLAMVHGWNNGECHMTAALDGNITLRVDSNANGTSQSGYYYTGDWRIYQARVDSFWLEAADGATIDSVQLTYNTSNDGTWSTKRGSNLAEADRIASGTMIYVGGQSRVCLYMGTTSDKTNGQLRVTKFHIIYQGAKQKETPVVKFESPKVYAYLDDATCTNTLSNNSDGAVTYESSNTGVATVDAAGNVTLVGLGDATITAHVAESENYVEAEASYVVRVMPTDWHMETFTGAETANTNYATAADKSVNVSEATGLRWEVLFGFIGANSGNMEGAGAVVRQRKAAEAESACGYLLSDTIEGGIDSLRFRWNSNGSESGNWNIIVYINNDSVGTITESATAAKPAAEVPSFSVGGLKHDGKFVIRIVNAAAASGKNNAKRFVVDDVEWFSYEAPFVPTDVQETEQANEKATKVVKNGQLYILKGGRYLNVLGF